MSHFVIIHLNIQTGALHLTVVHSSTNDFLAIYLLHGFRSLIWTTLMLLSAFMIHLVIKSCFLHFVACEMCLLRNVNDFKMRFNEINNSNAS